MPIRSQLSSIVATQLGRLQGELEARVQDEASKLVNEFSSGCPNREKLVKIVKTRNTLLGIINSFQRLVNRFGALPAKLRRPISGAKVVISLLKRNPTPLAVGTSPGPSGGLLFAKSAGFATSQADRLQKVNLLLEALEDDTRTLEDLVRGIQPNLQNIKSILNSVNDNVENCANELQESASSSDSSESSSTSTEEQENLKDLLKQVQPVDGSFTAGSSDITEKYRAANGRDYTLEILQEQVSTGPVPRRFAVAKDNIGVIVLKGQPSFSSDTSVLIDELKFRIDNQLP